MIKLQTAKPLKNLIMKNYAEQLAKDAKNILSNLTLKDSALLKSNPKYIDNLKRIADTGESTSLATVRGTSIPSARMIAFLPETQKTGIHGYQGRSIADPKHRINYGILSQFISDNKLNAARYFAQHEELIVPFLKSSTAPAHQKKMLIELLQDGILAPLKQKGLKQFEKNNLWVKRAEKAGKDSRIYDGTMKSLFEQDKKTHDILNWDPVEYQQFVDNVDLLSQHLPPKTIEKLGGLREAIVPLHGLYTMDMKGHYYQDPLNRLQTISRYSPTGLVSVDNPKTLKNLMQFQNSNGLTRVLGQRGDLQTLMYENVMDPLPGHTISTRSKDVFYIKKGSKIKKKWKPKL